MGQFRGALFLGLAAVFCAGAPLADARAVEELVLAKWAEPPLASADGKGFLDQIINEVFSRIDIKVRLIKLPAERALINANNGIEDGDALRVEGLEKIYPNLVRVPEQILDMEFVAFSKTVDISVNGWDSLKPYVVGIVTGWKILEKNLADAKTLTTVNTPVQLFILLKNNRADIVVFERWQGIWIAKQLGLKILVLEPPVASRPMFIYLHKKHLSLVPKVAQTLVKMKQDGSYDLFVANTLKPLLERP